MLQDSGEVSKHLKAYFFLWLLHLHIVVATQVAILTVVYQHFEREKQWKYERRN